MEVSRTRTTNRKEARLGLEVHYHAMRRTPEVVSGHRGWPIADPGFFKSAAESISNLDEPIEVCPPFARDRNLGRPFLFIGAA